MIRSMTGFGRSQHTGTSLNFSVEMNTVNRRTLEFGMNLPREWQSMEGPIQEVLKKHLDRGRIHLSIQGLPHGEASGFQWDEEGLKGSFLRLQSFAEREGIPCQIDAEVLIRLAALNKKDGVLPVSDAVEGAILEAVAAACAQVVEMRTREGSVLCEDLGQRLDSIETFIEEITSCSRQTVPKYRELLMQRLAQANLELNLGDERVLKEVAIFADKCDIAEELTRLGSHIGQFRECLEAGSPIGRKLEFILQEINREINTIGSKANNYGVGRQVIECKNEIERIREQIQNIE